MKMLFFHVFLKNLSGFDTKTVYLTLRSERRKLGQKLGPGLAQRHAKATNNLYSGGMP